MRQQPQHGNMNAGVWDPGLLQCITCSGEVEFLLPRVLGRNDVRTANAIISTSPFTDNTLIKPSHDHSLAIPLFATPDIFAGLIRWRKGTGCQWRRAKHNRRRFACGMLTCSAAKKQDWKCNWFTVAVGAEGLGRHKVHVVSCPLGVYAGLRVSSRGHLFFLAPTIEG